MIEGTQFKNNQIVGYPYKTDRALHGIASLTNIKENYKSLLKYN